MVYPSLAQVLQATLASFRCALAALLLRPVVASRLPVVLRWVAMVALLVLRVVRAAAAQRSHFLAERLLLAPVALLVLLAGAAD